MFPYDSAHEYLVCCSCETLEEISSRVGSWGTACFFISWNRLPVDGGKFCPKVRASVWFQGLVLSMWVVRKSMCYFLLMEQLKSFSFAQCSVAIFWGKKNIFWNKNCLPIEIKVKYNFAATLANRAVMTDCIQLFIVLEVLTTIQNNNRKRATKMQHQKRGSFGVWE